MNAPLPPDAVAVAELPVAAIVASPSNPRKHIDDAYIAELAESIKAHGLIQPITVRPLSLDALFAFNKRAHPDDERPVYEIVVGECRWRAAKAAGLENLPAFWRELDDKQVLEIQVVENLQRRDVHPIEEAEGYEALMKRHNYKADEIAAKIGKSRGYVYARLKLLALGRDAREEFFGGKLEASTALLIARIPPSLQKKALKSVIEGYNGEPVSYRTAKHNLASAFTISLKHATFPLDDATLAATAGSCTACPKRAGNDLVMEAEGIDADVCTDTICFEEKRLARRAQLIANAEKRKIPVIAAGPEAWEFCNDDGRADLDDPVDDDDQGRTYREILGGNVPKPVALVEIGHGTRQRLAEIVDVTALEKALQKAGWTPAGSREKTDDPDAASRAEKRRLLEEEQKANFAKREAMKATQAQEQARRVALADTLFGRLQRLGDDGELNTDPLLSLLCAAWLRLDFSFQGEVDAPRLERFGITVPVDPLAEGQDEYDDAEELEKVAALVQAWPPGKALAFLFDVTTSEETNVANLWNYDPETDRAHTLEALEKLLNPADSSMPAEAAPAKEKKPAAKKAKGKAEPAPAESSRSTIPWPFPAQATA
jgi:ParB/RepB/Spo0J family partition protein